MFSQARPQSATEPLPTRSVTESVETPATNDVKVEEIALHVPEECFYVRFGNFPNYLWFSRLLREFGGDLRTLIAMRGLDYGLNARQEQQLVLKESGLAELLGPQVIADVALVGQDMFMREGAAIGIMFQARSNFGLGSDFRSQRAAALKANKDATESTVDVGGHKVSFLSTPDNRIRSFYAVDGDFHFVTTSRALVARFYEAGAGERALGKSDEFRLARAEVPLERDDTVFAYLSAEFFQNLLGPHYRIEMTPPTAIRRRDRPGEDGAARGEERRPASCDDRRSRPGRFLALGIRLACRWQRNRVRKQRRGQRFVARRFGEFYASAGYRLRQCHCERGRRLPAIRRNQEQAQQKKTC